MALSIIPLLLHAGKISAQDSGIEERERLGEALIERGERDSALTVFEGLIADAPERGAGYLGRGYLRVKDDPEGGEADLRRGLKILGDTCYLCFERLARSAVSRGDLDEALRLADSGVLANDERAEGLIFRANLRWHRGEDPVPDLTRAIERDASSAVAYATRADYYISNGGFLSARGDARKAQELDTAWGYPYALLSRIAAGRGDTTEAIALATAAIDHGWERSRIYFDRAFYYMGRGEFEKAEADFTSCLEIDPENGSAWGNRANVRYRMEDMEGTCDDAAMAMKYADGDQGVIAWGTQLRAKLCDSSELGYYVHRGIAAYNRGAFAEAIDHYNTGLRKFPGSPMLRWTRGNAQVRLKNWSEAEREYRYALDSIDRYVAELARTNMGGDMNVFGPTAGLTNTMTASLYLQIAEVLAAQGKMEGAHELIDRAIPYAPRGSDISIQLGVLRGNIAMEKGNREEAETFFRGAMREAPGNPTPALLLSATLLDEAIERSSGSSSATTTITLGLTNGRSSRPLTATLPIASSTTPGTINRERVEEAITILTRVITLNPQIGAAWYIRYRARRLIGADEYCDDLREAQRLEYPDALRGEEC